MGHQDRAPTLTCISNPLRRALVSECVDFMVVMMPGSLGVIPFSNHLGRDDHRADQGGAIAHPRRGYPHPAPAVTHGRDLLGADQAADIEDTDAEALGDFGNASSSLGSTGRTI